MNTDKTPTIIIPSIILGERSVLSDHVADGDLIMFYTITILLHNIPNDEKYKYNCHTLSRAIAGALQEATVVSGHVLGLEQIEKKGFAKGLAIRYCSHSWIRTPDGAIIDPYPVGYINLQPVLIPSKPNIYSPFGRCMYVENPDDHDFKMTKQAEGTIKALQSLFIGIIDTLGDRYTPD